MSQVSGSSTKLIYSYSHIDSSFRSSMESSLSLLKMDGLLQDWSDNQILPGQEISATVRANIDNADIIAFLISPDFLASPECMKEWDYAKQRASEGRLLIRIPIIVRDCPWLDFLKSDDIKALPNDGTPVAKYGDQDTAWRQVYDGIKAVVERLNATFTLKPEFAEEMARTDFIAQRHIDLREIFVFPRLLHRTPRNLETEELDELVTSHEDLLRQKLILLHGPDSSGKTALARHTFLTLVDAGQPALYVDLAEITRRLDDRFLSETYRSQFNGDYALWGKRTGKVLVIDNLNAHQRHIQFLKSAEDSFDTIIATLSSDLYYSYFRDDSRLAHYEELEILPLSHVQQEDLIRKRSALLNSGQPMTDGEIDQIENRVNSIIIDGRILPRYAFFVLAILQTYEAYMPSGMAITAYGHCYHALIVARLIRAGISNKDSDINVCLNFAEQLAIAQYHHEWTRSEEPFDFEQFIKDYKERYYISDSVINRLKHREFGLITDDGGFRTPYMGYFFLGKHLANAFDSNKEIITAMCDAIHVASSHLTLLFAIHHSTDSRITEEILLRTLVALDEVPPATLGKEETARFRAIVSAIPDDILTAEDVDSTRRRERNQRDIASAGQKEDADEQLDSDAMEIVNSIYRIRKSNEIIGQILRNSYGSMEKRRVEEIIEIVADGGLRLVNLILKSDDEMAEVARYLHQRFPDKDIEAIRLMLDRVSFLWTMINIECVVSAMNIPEIRQAINGVVSHNSTPAYDLIGYFTRLDTAMELNDSLKDELARLLNRHDDPFIRSVLSIRTQHYMNTHRSPAPIEQAICARLNIKYRQRLIRPR